MKRNYNKNIAGINRLGQHLKLLAHVVKETQLLRLKCWNQVSRINDKNALKLTYGHIQIQKIFPGRNPRTPIPRGPRLMRPRRGDKGGGGGDGSKGGGLPPASRGDRRPCRHETRIIPTRSRGLIWVEVYGEILKKARMLVKAKDRDIISMRNWTEARLAAINVFYGKHRLTLTIKIDWSCRVPSFERRPKQSNQMLL